MELREKFILADGASQGMAAFRPRGRRSRPSSRGASPNRSTSLSSQAGQAASPQVPVTSTPKVGCGHETFLCFYTIGVLRILWNVLGPQHLQDQISPFMSLLTIRQMKDFFFFFFGMCFCLWPTQRIFIQVLWLPYRLVFLFKTSLLLVCTIGHQIFSLIFNCYHSYCEM